MSSDLVLVTGGAGFIGSHLVDRLVADGRPVRVLDSLDAQVHQSGSGYRNAGADYHEGSLLDRHAVDAALTDVGAVVHLAAQVGVGQSMYEIARYVRENSLGTAILLESMLGRTDAIRSLIVASSMSIYGEGAYACPACGPGSQVVRAVEQLQDRRWEPHCALCGSVAIPQPTPESKAIECDSIYAITKRDHEELCLVFGRAYGIRTVALRFFNVFGPRQSLSNPYTGVGAIFASRLLNQAAPLVFEDGLQSRDFVHVSDIVNGVELALCGEASDVAVNLGTGAATTVLDVANVLATQLGVDIKPEVVGRFRKGDIRHCFADISAARRLLGYEPRVDFETGMRELASWMVEEEPAAQDNVERATAELTARGLVL